jgi:hypothetical protein
MKENRLEYKHFKSQQTNKLDPPLARSGLNAVSSRLIPLEHCREALLEKQNHNKSIKQVLHNLQLFLSKMFKLIFYGMQVLLLYTCFTNLCHAELRVRVSPNPLDVSGAVALRMRACDSLH